MKKCPYCLEEVQEEAIKCKHCNEFISATYFYDRGVKKRIEKKYADALDDFEKAFGLNETNGVYAGEVGRCFFLLGKYKEAKHWFGIARDLVPEHSSGMDLFANLSELKNQRRKRIILAVGILFVVLAVAASVIIWKM